MPDAPPTPDLLLTPDHPPTRESHPEDRRMIPRTVLRMILATRRVVTPEVVTPEAAIPEAATEEAVNWVGCVARDRAARYV
jgi:hypothetical protein